MLQNATILPPSHLKTVKRSGKLFIGISLQNEISDRELYTLKNELIESFLIQNGNTVAVNLFKDIDTGTVSIYEVIRVIRGISLFLERHLERLEGSARLLGHSIASLEKDLREAMKELIHVNGAPEKNIKLIIYDLSSGSPKYLMGFIQSSYPTLSQYKCGVPVLTYEAVRHNPNAKVINAGFKEDISRALAEAGAYEALLVNEKQQLTEGSRSNLFFVKQGRLYTAPKADVLVGITRIYVFELCEALGIELREQLIPLAFLQEADGLFLTGTSPKILPIGSVNGRSFDSAGNEAVLRLRHAYDRQINDYIQSHG